MGEHDVQRRHARQSLLRQTEPERHQRLVPDERGYTAIHVNQMTRTGLQRHRRTWLARADPADLNAVTLLGVQRPSVQRGLAATCDEASFDPILKHSIPLSIPGIYIHHYYLSTWAAEVRTRWNMSKKLAVSTAVAALVASIPTHAFAQAAAPQSTTPTPAPSAETQKRDKVVDEAAEALRETQNAIEAIDQNKPDDAIAALTRATGKLEIVLARNPGLGFAMVGATVSTHDVVATEADVEKLRGQAAAALAQGQLQVARRLISDLASETVVSVSKLPLATYPDALKKAAALLHDGKAQAAKVALQATLSTLVVEDVIIPLPLVRAQAALEQARNLLEKKKRSEAESTQMRAYLATATAQLRLGRALGYATEAEMTDLLAMVADIERRTAGSQSATGLLDPAGSKFDAARRSSQPRK
ncbi:hypothetical protein LTR94_012574 [Friedmanniomyces endolithicus]|nr:hypothetical protein LTR94_012574 [Friedmanniomyces endolithicus]